MTMNNKKLSNGSPRHSLLYLSFLNYNLCKILIYSNNRITKDGASKLNKGLMVNETLKVLRLGQNPMQSEGAFLILSAVKNNTNIALIEVELLVCMHNLIIDFF